MKKLPIITIGLLLGLFLAPKPSFAAASFALSGPSSGNSVTISLGVNTNGTAENTFDVIISYSGATANVAASYNGSTCTLTPFNPKVTATTVEIYCGAPNPGMTGSLTIGTISATIGANATFTITSAKAYMNDGHGTLDTTSSTGSPVVINNGGGTSTPTPTPTPSPSGSSTPTPTSSGHPTSTPKTTPLSVASPSPFNGKPTPKPTVTTANQPTLVVVTQPPYKAPTGVQNQGTEQTVVTPSVESIQTLVQGYFNNTAAAMLFVLPILILLIMVGFLTLRMYQMTRRRQREVELLFEHELGELAALESKLDLLNEKGTKGREDFKQEFERTKDQILKEIRPQYIGKEGEKPVEKVQTQGQE